MKTLRRVEPISTWLVLALLLPAQLAAQAPGEPAARVATRSSSESSETAKLVASDGVSGDSFAKSVAISGNRLVAGAYLEDDAGPDAGSAYVFERDATGMWVEAAKLLASDGSSSDEFGVSVAISGAHLVAGALFDDAAGTLSGSAYVFRREATGPWVEAAKLVASDGSDSDLFGGSVAISGNRLVVGAYLDDPAGADSGSAYVFERDAAGAWLEVGKLVASDGSSGDQFGISVGISGERLVVGAYLDNAPRVDSGSAYVFERNATGDWVEVAKLVPSDGSANDRFGLSVGLSGRRLVAGAYLDDAAGSDSGSAYVFERRAGVWTEAARLVASDGSADDLFGFSVGISGRRLLVGTLLDDDAGADAGSVYVFERRAGTWAEVAKLSASDGSGGDAFGVSVAISGDGMLTGASGDDGARGSAYVFEAAPTKER